MSQNILPQIIDSLTRSGRYLSNHKFELLCAFLSIVPIFILFFIFPIPPVVDVLGFIAFSLTPTGNNQLYLNGDGLTYQTFHILLKSIATFLGPHFTTLCIISMITMFSLLLIIPLIKAFFANEKPVFVLIILPGFAFLIMHSLLFIWGVFPTILAGWLAILAAFVFLHCDVKLSRTWNKHDFLWLITGIVLAFLSVYAHPLGFLIFFLGFNFLIVRLCIEKNNRFKRLLLLVSVNLLFSIYLFFTYMSIMSDYGVTNLSNNPMHYLNLSINFFSDRFALLFGGGGYNSSILFPQSFPIFNIIGLKTILTLLPFICILIEILFILQIRKTKHNENPYNLMNLFLLCLLSVGIFIAPLNYNNGPAIISMLPLRLLAISSPLCLNTFSRMGTFFTIKSHNHNNYYALLGPIISILIISSFIGTYSQSQEIVSTSEISSNLIEKNVDLIRVNIGQTNSSTIITPIPSQFGQNNFQFRTIPFLLLYDKNLLNDKIYIIHEWTPYPYQPIILNKDFLDQKNILFLTWDTEYYPNIILLSDRQMVPINLTNLDFENGISRNETKYIIHNNVPIATQLKVGNIIKFSGSGIREITKIEQYNDNLEIYTNGTVLNPAKDGFPNLVERIN